MNSLNLSLFDSVALSAAEYSARPAATPRVRTRTAPLKGQPASLWQESLAAHEPTARARWAQRGSFTVLGAVSAGSVVYALTAIGHGVLAHDGLQAAVRSLMH